MACASVHNSAIVHAWGQIRICHNPDIRNLEKLMDVVKLGKKGQVSLPAAVLRKLGLQGRGTLIVEATDDGAVILRPAGVYPIELYTDERIREFERENSIPSELAARVDRVIKSKRKKRR